MSEYNLNLDDMYIVLVEGSDTQVNVIQRQFNLLAISNIKVVSTGTEALEAISIELPDLLISSMYLEDMTAADLIHQIREDESLEEVPFLLISSETSFKALDPVRQAGVVDILEKPFDANGLKAALQKALDFINIEDKSELFSDIEMEYVRVLIVDDSSMARKHTRRILSSLGVEDIDEAINGQDAIPYIDQNFYDLVITDYNMPEMDGLALLNHVRQHEEHKNVPVLMITSEADKARIEAVHQAGINAVCGKPYENEVLIEHLKEILVDV